MGKSNITKSYLLILIGILAIHHNIKAQSAKSDSLFAIGLDLYKADKLQEAIPFFNESYSINKEKNDWGIKQSNYSAMYLASCYYKLGNYVEAIKYGLEDLRTKKIILGSESLGYASSLNNLALYNSMLNNYSEALRLEMDVVKIREKKLGKNDPDYAVALHNCAFYNSELDNNSEALRLELEVVKIRESKLGNSHPDYAIALNSCALYNSKLGNYSKAILLELEVIQILERTLGKEHSDYATALNNLATYYSNLGNYSEAIRVGTESLKILENGVDKAHLDNTTNLHNLAGYNAEIGNYHEAIRLETEAIRRRENMHGKEDRVYATLLCSLSSFNSLLGNYYEAILLETESLQIRERVLGKKHRDYVNSLNNLAHHNSSLGNYKEAIRLVTEALQIEENTLGKNNPDYATSLSNLASYLSSLGDYHEAIRIGEEALLIREKVLGKKHLDYAGSLNNLATYNSKLGNYSEAIRLNLEALQIEENVLGKEHPNNATILSNLAFINSLLGNYHEAIRIGEEALQIRERVLGKEHPDYANSIYNLAGFNFFLGNIPALEKYTISFYNSFYDIVRKNFANMLEHERSMFWEKYQKAFQIKIHQFSYKHPTESLIQCCYNATLLSKGLLLNLSQEMFELIQSCGDKDALSLYTKLKKIRLTIQKTSTKPIGERTVNVDSLEEIATRIERDLLEKSKVYGDYMKDMSINWKDVEKKICLRDICVEFVSFPLTNDSTMYIAYVLKKGMTCPKMIPLFEEKQLKKGESLYKNASVSKLVWEPLAEYLIGVQNVYFAPSGELYNMGIEYLPHWSGEGIMSEKWNMYRLSSTRQLAVIKDKNALKQASVYGGVKYDTKEDLLVADSRKYRSQERSFNYEPFAIADSLNLRAGASYLPATKVEAEEIDKTLEQKKITTKLLIDTLATEGAFKDLSGKKTNLLHIATHGFYWTEKEAKYKDNLSFLMLNDNQPRYLEDKSLTRSGLLLAGANNALMGKKLPEGVDDGILTAKEISQLDLRGLDLVVLSACETGLGEIKGDGVFGLQRGFKKAGANSLLMSLWKVDDEATRLLMTQFYKNLTSGMSKYESLRQAQKYLREYEVEVDVKSDTRPAISARAKEQAQQNANKETTFKKVKKYEDPKYWAAFILLDAVD